MRRVNHWSFLYFINRFNKFKYELKNPFDPFLNRDVIFFLKKYLNKKDFVVEFGSGRSTLWFSNYCKSILSFESNKQYFNMLLSKVEKNHIQNCEIRFCHSLEDYIFAINSLDNNSIDVCLVDSENYRFEIMINIVSKIRNGGILLIDDANRYFPSDSVSPDSLRSIEFMNPLVVKFSELVHGKRRMWTSDGVHDTLIIFF